MHQKSATTSDIRNTFLAMLMPMKTSSKGIEANIDGHDLFFEFISQPILREINDIIHYKSNHINFLQQELKIFYIEETLQKIAIKEKISQIEQNFKNEVCSDIPNAFWERKKHIVSLPYEKGFDERKIPTKACPSQMKQEYLIMCQNEINSLMEKKIIRKSYSPWSCTAFYVNKNAEKERGVPRLVINYMPLNDVLMWIRYPMPNKKDLLERLNKAIIFSKFDLKSGFWQIQINEIDRYKTAFTVPFGHYEWNVMPFGLKNASSEFQKIMNDILYPYVEFAIRYVG